MQKEGGQWVDTCCLDDCTVVMLGPQLEAKFLRIFKQVSHDQARAFGNTSETDAILLACTHLLCGTASACLFSGQSNLDNLCGQEGASLVSRQGSGWTISTSNPVLCGRCIICFVMHAKPDVFAQSFLGLSKNKSPVEDGWVGPACRRRCTATV